MEAHTHGAEGVELGVDHAVGEAEFGDAVFQHAAHLVKSLEDIDLKAHSGHGAGKRQSGRSGACHGHSYAVGLGHIGLRAAAGYLAVGGEALEVAYGHGLLLHLMVYAAALALLLLGAHTAAHGRQSAGAL